MFRIPDLVFLAQTVIAAERARLKIAKLRAEKRLR